MAKKHKKRRKGEWEPIMCIVKEGHAMTEYRCSYCNSPQTFTDLPPYFLYCPICGAKMIPRV